MTRQDVALWLLGTLVLGTLLVLGDRALRLEHAQQQASGARHHAALHQLALSDWRSCMGAQHLHERTSDSEYAAALDTCGPAPE